MKKISNISQQLKEYEHSLRLEEKSSHTVEKYLHDVRHFLSWLDDHPICKERMIAYKQFLLTSNYAAASINSKIASVNSFLSFLHCEDYKVRHIKTQRKIYCPGEKELTREEYVKLLDAAKGRPRLRMIIETICATGIRISELRFFTVEAVRRGEIIVSCKNKTRTILLPAKLKKQLLVYAGKQKIRQGIIFRTKGGRPMNRSNIWSDMKKLCAAAHVQESKVFPHNLRKLFARTFYNNEKDIAKLADLLGHSNINTTRIYIMTTSLEHQKKIDRLGLVV
ncbi:MAG: tyrosine-type recombinase/integrase [Eubacterium sp.]|nr:tyrosine-type recombinase/integrase [Eubacterium sp.]